MQWFRKRTEMGMIGHGCSTCLNDSNWRPFGDPTWPSKGLDLHLRDAGWGQQSVRRLQLLRPRCRSSMCGLGNYQCWHLKACLLNMIWNLQVPPRAGPNGFRAMQVTAIPNWFSWYGDQVWKSLPLWKMQASIPNSKAFFYRCAQKHQWIKPLQHASGLTAKGHQHTWNSSEETMISYKEKSFGCLMAFG